MPDQAGERKEKEDSLGPTPVHTAVTLPESYRFVFECAPYPVSLSTISDCRYIDVNPAFERIFGVPRETARGKTPLELGILQDPEVQREIFAEAARTSRVDTRVIAANKPSGGSAVWLFSGQRVDLQGEPILLAFAVDITQAVTIERSLRASEELHREVVSSLPGGVFRFYARATGEMGIQFASGQVRDLFGLDPSVEGLLERFILAVYEEDRPRFLQSVQEAVTQKSNWHFEGRIVTGKRGLRWFSGQSVPVQKQDELIFHGFILDITEQKLVEAQVRQNDAWLRSLLRVSQLAAQGSQGLLAIALEEATTTTGSALGFALLLGNDQEDLQLAALFQGSPQRPTIESSHVLSWARDNPLINSVLNKREPVLLQGETELAFGCRRCLLVPVLAGDSLAAVAGLLGRASDYEQSDALHFSLLLDAAWKARERERALQALHRSEHRLRLFFEQAFMAVFLVDGEGKVSAWNSAMETLSGLGRQDVVGSPAWQVLHRMLPPSRRTQGAAERLRATVAEALRTGTTLTGRREQRECVHADGHSFSFEYFYSPIRIDDSYEVAFLGHDVTERTRALAELVHREERFRLLVQNSKDFIVVTDDQFLPIFVSGPVQQILGYRPEELLGTSPFDWAHPSDRERLTALLADALRHPGATKTTQYRYRHKNGGWVNVEAAGVNLLHEPAVRGVVLNVRDLSERMQAEEEKAKLEEQLRQAVKMEAVGRLAGGVAHDFNNLLTAIKGQVELALLDLSPGNPLQSTLEDIDRAAESAAALTRQLLAFSRKQILEPKVIDLNELITNLNKMLVRLIGEDIVLRVVLAEPLGAVRVDPGQFEQVLVNLIVNARDAMPEGGELSIETRNVVLDPDYCRLHSDAQPGPHAVLIVRDTGQGMSPEVLEHLFEPFFTTKAKGHGTGLGLATIYGAVQQAGGHVAVISEPGKGTTFQVHLPCVQELPESLAVRQRSDLPQACGGETILLVEDEALVRDLAARLLRRWGYQVLDAAEGAEALALAKQHTGTIQLMITDVVMPGMNGKQLAERLKTLHPETRVLYTSGYTDEVIAHRGLLERGLHFLGKPYAPRSLAAKIREVLDSRESTIPR